MISLLGESCRKAGFAGGEGASSALVFSLGFPIQEIQQHILKGFWGLYKGTVVHDLVAWKDDHFLWTKS